MKTVSVFDLRDDLATYLASVREEGAKLVVRRFGKPIALITPYTADAIPRFAEYFGFLPKAGGRGMAVLARRRRSVGEKKRTIKLRS